MTAALRNTILCGDARAKLREIPADSVHCVITSPPYWSLRDYGVEAQVWGGDPACRHEWQGIMRQDERYTGKRKWQHIGEEAHANGVKVRDVDANAWGHPQVEDTSSCSRCGAQRGALGLEPTPAMYVAHLVEVMREVRRVLRKDGTLFLNLGDSYAGSWGAMSYPSGSIAARRFGGNNAENVGRPNNSRLSGYLKPKDLVGIPWSVAFALQQDGWWLRSDIVWSKTNPMPESVRDRPTRSHGPNRLDGWQPTHHRLAADLQASRSAGHDRTSFRPVQRQRYDGFSRAKSGP